MKEELLSTLGAAYWTETQRSTLSPASLLRLMGKDGRILLEIMPDGTVTGEIENAGEAARVFVDAIRHQIEPMIRAAALRASVKEQNNGG